MERDSVLYSIRRRAQVFAHYVINDELLSKFYYRIVLKKKLDIHNPKTFNEKIQWCKLYYFPQNKLVVRCADKFEVRQYIIDKGFENTLIPLLGSWDNAHDIEWDKLPEQFVLKCNHGCAYNIVCTNIATFHKEKAIHQLNNWLKEDFGSFNLELHYSMIKPRKIICEKYLGDCITDYKFFCFHGEPKFVYVSKDLIHDRQAQIGFFYLDGSKMPLKRDDYVDINKVILPSFYSDMLFMAKTLSEDFLFVRVDFFISNNNFYFAELTFTPGAGLMPFNPDSFDLKWGQMLNITELKESKILKK